MKHYHRLLFFLFLVVSNALPAQTSDKYLKRLPQPESTLFFIKPVKLKIKGSSASLHPDFTYTHFPAQTSPGEATINFTIRGKEPLEKLDSLTLAGRFTAVPSFLFLEQKKGTWSSRFSATIPLDILFSLLEEQGGPFAVVAVGSQRLTVPYNKAWHKMSGAILPVLRSEIK